MSWIWVSIGSNINREHNTRAAVSALRTVFGDLKLSPVYETEAVGFDGDPFYNLVAGFSTVLTAQETTAIMKDIEAFNGRQQESPKFASRTLDIDLLTYGNSVIEQDGLQIPRDEILKYAFVLKPLADVAPDECHPVDGRSYLELWNNFQEKQSLKEIAFDWKNG